MRIALPIAFLVGLTLKVLHLPYHTVFLLVVLAAGLGWVIAQWIRSADKSAWLTALAIWAWAAHLVALLKLFTFRSVTLGLAAVLTFIAFILLVRKGGIGSRSFLALAGSVIVVLLVMTRPTSTRFHFTNLAFSVERTTDYTSWDKYSFFLAREGRVEEALAANKAAVEAAMVAHDEVTAERLKHRPADIEMRTWDRFVPLAH